MEEGHVNPSPKTLQGSGALQARLGCFSQASFQECCASFSSPGSLRLPLQGAKNLLRAGGDGVFAMRRLRLVGGNIGTLWPPPSPDH